MPGRKTATSPRTTTTDFVWGDLTVALAIDRTRTLSGAARELGVERTTVGRRLTALEEALGAKLFDRTPDGYVPTAAGQSVLSRAREIENLAVSLERAVQGEDARVAGTVRVTALDPFICDILLPHLGELTAAHPELVVIADPDTRMLSLSRREADIAIRHAPPTEPDHVGRRLGEFRSALYASRDYVARRGIPRDLVGLRDHDLVMFAPELARAPEEAWLAERAPTARVAVRVSTPSAHVAAIRQGLGVGVLPCHTGLRDPDLVRVSDEIALTESYWAVVHVDLARTPRLRAVLDYLSAQSAAMEARERQAASGSG